MPALAALPIADTPVAILDFETTGLRPGADRVVEVAVVRIDPGHAPRLVLDTLVNPGRPMACTEIHGISDSDVADAPAFSEIAPVLLSALSGCAMAAYNVYFDLKFLKYELRRAGRENTPPHFCLMYLRTMLGLGGRRSLDDACREHGIWQQASHEASADVMAEAELYRFYQGICRDRELCTFGDLAQLRDYKFCESFDWEPLLFQVSDRQPRVKSRRNASPPEPRVADRAIDAPVPLPRVPQERRAPLPGWRPTKTPPLRKGGPGGVASPGDHAPTPHDRRPTEPTPHSELATPRSPYALRQYWEALKLVLSDLEISDGELEYIERKKRELTLTDEEIRVQHARAFASVIAQFADDQRLDGHECRKLNRLHRALARLGWAPGQ